MENKVAFPENILADNIDGFHRYCFAAPVRPDYISDNLLRMLGYSREELLYPEKDGYALLVHPEDQTRYQAFLHALSQEEQRLTIQYRLLHKSGSFIHVQDCMTSRRRDDQTMEGFSTLTDITAIRMENEALHALNETVPCGIVKYTCSSTPRVTYINDRMLKILRFSKSPEQLEQYRQNVYLLISPEERSNFHRFLDQVYAQETPIAGETTLLRCDGTRVRLYGWITKNVSSDGEEEFQSVCMDVTDRYERKRKEEAQNYIHALSQVYDEICELDFRNQSIRFLHGRFRDHLGGVAQMSMSLADVANYFIDNMVEEEDRAKFRAAMTALQECPNVQDQPLRHDFHVRLADGSVRHYESVCLETTGAGVLFCCRNVASQQALDALKEENHTLRNITERMQEMVLQFVDGMMAFKICGDKARPLYVSDNICRYFGYTRDEWLEKMQTMTSIQEFVSHCHLPYESFLEVLEGQEGEFHYTDVTTQECRRIKAIRTLGDLEDGSYYVMFFDVTSKDATHSGVPAQSEMPDIYVRTFGYFDVFINDNPIAFRNEKAKELFALLVDRRGGFITSAEAIALLWEDEPANPVTLARYRKVALRLKNTLEEYGIADVVESIDGKRRIVPRLLRCDLYEYLSGEAKYTQLFKGNYLQNYSWGEVTLAELSEKPF